jgi:hypothetical protein
MLLSAFVPSEYGPVLGSLVETDRRRPLTGGVRDPRARDRLRGVSVEDAFAHAALADFDMGRCCLAGLWLVYDFLDDAHEISQRIDTPTGSLWHAIMHRREGDYANAKYWLRRAGSHDVLVLMSQRMNQSGEDDNNVELIQRLAALQAEVLTRSLLPTS